METGQVATLDTGWLDTTTASGTIMTNSVDTQSFLLTNCTSCYHVPCTCSNTFITTTWPLSKITLKMSEVEKLRAVAKKNPEIKKILNKFTSHIEIEVDF